MESRSTKQGYKDIPKGKGKEKNKMITNYFKGDNQLGRGLLYMSAKFTPLFSPPSLFNTLEKVWRLPLSDEPTTVKTELFCLTRGDGLPLARESLEDKKA